MKSIVIISFIVLITLVSCSKQNAASTTPINETIDTTSTGSMLKYSGTFMNGPYGSTIGAARIYLQNGKYTLALGEVSISNGPDLHVYLSKEIQPINFIDLGKLKSTSGNQLYDIPIAPDFLVFKYALIHCQQYNHLFGSAELQK